VDPQPVRQFSEPDHLFEIEFHGYPQAEMGMRVQRHVDCNPSQKCGCEIRAKAWTTPDSPLSTALEGDVSAPGSSCNKRNAATRRMKRA